MLTAPSAQTYPIKHFLFGFVIGIGNYSFIGLFFSALFTFLNAKFTDLFDSNISLIGLLSLVVHWSFYSLLIIMLQKKLNSKFITIGAASGIIASTILMGIVLS